MKRFLFIIVLVSMIVVCFAQTDFSSTSFGTSSAYLYSGTLADAERLMIKTYIWGQVSRPGLYIVPDDTDLLALVSLAGGPKEEAKLSKVRIIRPTKDGDEKIIWVDLREYIETGDEDLIPIMKPNDTVVVSGTLYAAFIKFTQFLSNAAIALSIYNMLVNM